MASPALALEVAERRRSSRLPIKVRVVVCGESADRQHFQEETLTLSVNEHGALVALAMDVKLGQRLLLLNPLTWNEKVGRVSYLGAVGEGRTQVGIQFSER
jgi:hypothetical protein